LIDSTLGTLTIVCAAIDDVTAWCVVAIVLGVVSAGLDLLSIFATLLATVIFAAFMLFVVRPVVHAWARARMRESIEIPLHAVNVVVMLAVGSALVTEWIGVHALFGAFLAGLTIPRTNRLAPAVADRLEDSVGALLLPVFFAFSGLRTNMQSLAAPGWGC
jgi:Kef-type K+ transport system membrane component KefB